MVEYSRNPNDGFEKIYESTRSNGSNSFSWDLSSIPNYEANYLKFTCRDDENETILITEPFVINVKRAIYSSSQVEHISGKSTAFVEVFVADTSQINNDKYEITFAEVEGQKTYSIKNITTNRMLLEEIDLIDGLSSPTFEGLRLNIHDTEIGIDYNKTHFSNSELEATYNVFFSESTGDYIGSPHIKSALDWFVVFNDSETNSDG